MDARVKLYKWGPGEFNDKGRLQCAMEEGELAVWFPSLLAEAAHADGAPSMRAVEGNQTALTKNEWKE